MKLGSLALDTALSIEGGLTDIDEEEEEFKRQKEKLIKEKQKIKQMQEIELLK
jgi:hypothetical protein